MLLLKTSALWTVTRPCVEEADIARYRLGYEQGGIYHDNDVTFVVPPEQWPSRYPHLPWSKATLVVGIEFPDTGQVGIHVFAAAPNSGILKRAYRRALKNRKMGILKDPVQATGPFMFSQVLREVVGPAYDPQKVENSGGMAYNATLTKDCVIILPYRAFGIHPSHSHNKLPSSQVLVKHKFNGSWRGKQARKRCVEA